MKKALLLLIVLPALVFTAKAQLGYNYSQYSLGVGISSVKATTDIPYSTTNPAVSFTATYNHTPYTAFSIVYEFGQLSGGYSDYYRSASKGLTDAAASIAIPLAYAKIDPYFRDYVNQYQTIAVHADVQFGEFMDYSNNSLFNRAIRNIYVGTGIGMIYNKMTSINRVSPDSTYAYGGSDHSNNVIIPVRAGYQVKIYNAYDEPFVLLEAGYQMTYVFGYGLDGYSDPLFTNRKYEQYGGFHFGIKFNFGNVTSYRKEVH